MASYCRNLGLLLLNYQKPCNFNTVRNYGRWMHRKPGRVLLPFEPTEKPSLKKERVIDLDAEIFNKTSKVQPELLTEHEPEVKSESNIDVIKSTLPSDKRKEIKSLKDQKLKKQKFYLSQKKVFDDNGDIIYEKLNENDGRVSSLFVKLKSKKNRMKSDQMLVEGWRLIVDGLEAKCKLQYVIFSRTDELNQLKPYLPNTGVQLYKMSYKEMQLYSDVETASGLFGIFETPKSANIKRQSNPIPLQFLCDNIRMPGNLGAILRVAMGVGCDKVLLTKGCVDLWDPKVIRSAAGAHFRLPIHHSLDWTEINNTLEPNTSLFIADSNTNESLDDDDERSEGVGMGIPVLPYYSVEYPTLKHITLIVGGETEGISEDSFAFASQKNGLRLNIPLQKGVDSLNTGMAAAVIAFEIRKQLIQAWSKIRNDKIAQVT